MVLYHHRNILFSKSAQKKKLDRFQRGGSKSEAAVPADATVCLARSSDVAVPHKHTVSIWTTCIPESRGGDRHFFLQKFAAKKKNSNVTKGRWVMNAKYALGNPVTKSTPKAPHQNDAYRRASASYGRSRNYWQETWRALLQCRSQLLPIYLELVSCCPLLRAHIRATNGRQRGSSAVLRRTILLMRQVRTEHPPR